MAYYPIIQYTDFPQYVKIGINVDPAELGIHIKDMQELDFLSWTDDDFYNDVVALPYPTNRPELSAFVEEFVKPYLVCGAYHKFLLWSGRDVTQMGVRLEIDQSSQDIGDKARGELMADVKGKMNSYLARLTKQLCKISYKLDNKTYTFYDDGDKVRPKPSIGIKRVGPKQKYYDRKEGRWL